MSKPEMRHEAVELSNTSPQTELTTHNGFVDTQDIIAKWLPVPELVKVAQGERPTIELEGDDE